MLAGPIHKLHIRQHLYYTQNHTIYTHNDPSLELTILANTRECYTGPSGAVPLATLPATAAMTFYVTDPTAATATKVTCTGMCFARVVTAQTGNHS